MLELGNGVRLCDPSPADEISLCGFRKTKVVARMLLERVLLLKPGTYALALARRQVTCAGCATRVCSQTSIRQFHGKHATVSLPLVQWVLVILSNAKICVTTRQQLVAWRLGSISLSILVIVTCSNWTENRTHRISVRQKISDIIVPSSTRKKRNDRPFSRSVTDT